MTTDDKKEQIETDFEFSRTHYYELVDKGKEAIEMMMELARDSEHPRAFEVLATMIKTNAELADRLLDHQKKRKDALAEPKTASGIQPAIANSGGVTNNNLFVGSTKELAKMIEERTAAKQVKDVTEDDYTD